MLFFPLVAGAFNYSFKIVTEFVCGRDLQKMIDDDQWIIHTKERKAIAYQVDIFLSEQK